MRIALVHDYLIQDGGAERVLLALHEMYPDAPIFTLFHDPKQTHAGFERAQIITSPLNNRPFAPRYYQWYLPFMAHAVESFDLSDFDVVISNSSSFAKGAIAAPHATHICYCHTPTRFLWQDRLGYVNDLPQSWAIKQILPAFLHRLRQWDHLAAERPDILLTNSSTSQLRIRRYYKREAQIVHPPVDIDRIPCGAQNGTYWLSGGRLVPYKRFDLIVQAFNSLRLPLRIFGTGPEEQRLRRLAKPNVELVGRVTEDQKFSLYGDAIGFVHPQIEDFGITAVEAMAAGKPVIAYGKGGATETVLPGVTGEHFPVQCWQDIAESVLQFKPASYDPIRIRSHAEKFSKARFTETFQRLVQDALNTLHPTHG